MTELLSYKEARIDALTRRIADLEKQNETLTTYLIEVTDKDCPDDYKRVVRSEIWGGL